MKRLLKISLLALACLLGVNAMAQNNVSVSGTVVDNGNKPIEGAVVFVKGQTSTGTMTNAMGNFNLTVPKGSTLTVSCMGYKEQDLVAAEKMTVTLDDDSETIEETVVVGYGVQKKESVVGAISQVNNEALVNTGHTNVTQALAGKLSGVFTFQESGQPGKDNASIYIRGYSSWNSSSPLVMVDGVERSFNEINPNEVESISVLKDASATAVFGAKGANGVILVTTKVGEKGKPKMNLTLNYGMEQPQRLPTYIDAASTLEYYNIALKNAQSYSSQYSDDVIAKYRNHTDPVRYPDNNWFDLMLKDFSSSYNVNYGISGGGDKVRYYVNFGYVHEGSILKKVQDWKNNTFSNDRINYRVNLDFNVTKSTTISLKLGGFTKIVNEPDNTSVSTLFTNMYKTSNLTYPAFYGPEVLERIPDPDYPDEVGFRRAKSEGSMYSNPYNYIASGDFTQTTTNNLATDLSLKQKLDFITKGLYALGKVSYNTTFARYSQQADHSYPTYYIDWDIYDSGEGNPWVSSNSTSDVYVDTPYKITKNSTARNTAYTYYWEASLNYDRSFNKHNVNALALVNERNYVEQAQFPSRNESYVGRLKYDWNSTYLFEANLGITGSEQFAPSNRYGVFPSVAVGYVPSKTDFWRKSMPWWSTMKIRYSDGYVGSDIAAASWLYFSSYERNGDYILESSAANDTARWEKAHKRDLGFEMGWFRDNLVLTVDLFDEYRTDILTTPITTMFVQVGYKDVNSGEIKKHGGEVELKYRNTTSKGLFYEVGGMVGFNENRIIKYEDAPYAPEYQKKAGKAYGSTEEGASSADSGFFTSVDDLHGYPYFKPSDSVTMRPGAYKVVDYNGDCAIDTNDRYPVIGSTIPPVSYSGHFDIAYKGFSFGATLTGTQGKYIHFNNAYIKEFTTEEVRVHIAHTDFWTPTNLNATHGVLEKPQSALGSFGGNDSGGYKIDLMNVTWRKSDYFNIKDVHAAYKFDSEKVKRILGVAGLSVTLTGNNLYTWTKLIEGDPEKGTLSSSYYPLMRNVKLGVKLDF